MHTANVHASLDHLHPGKSTEGCAVMWFVEGMFRGLWMVPLHLLRPF